MKANEATLNRPEGDRVLDAPYVIANIEERVDQLKDEEAWDKNDRNGITLVKNEKMTIVLTCLQKKAEIRDNQLDGILTVQVLDGRIKVTTETNSFEMEKHSLVTIRANICHSILAEKESVILLTSVQS